MAEAYLGAGSDAVHHDRGAGDGAQEEGGRAPEVGGEGEVTTMAARRAARGSWREARLPARSSSVDEVTAIPKTVWMRRGLHHGLL